MSRVATRAEWQQAEPWPELASYQGRKAQILQKSFAKIAGATQYASSNRCPSSSGSR